jgi:hypothetical protein
MATPIYGDEKNDSDIVVASIGGDKTLAEQTTDLESSGWVSGGIATDAGSGTIDVSLAIGLIRASAVETADLNYFTATALTAQSIPTDTTRYLVANYNSGAPILQIATSDTSNGYNIIYLAEIHNIGGTLTIHNDPRPVSDLNNRLLLWATGLIGTRVASGEIVSDASPSSRKIAVTAGNTFDRFFRSLTTAAFDSSGAGTFTTFYRDGSGDWTRTSAQTDWPNTAWDDGDGGLATMTAAYYANLWVIRGFNGEIAVMYGQAEYSTQVAAEAEAAPASRPEEYDEHGYYIAQITFQKSDASPASITTIKPTLEGTTSVGSASVHNDLSGLQGGQAGQYQHLTTAEYAALQSGHNFSANSVGSGGQAISASTWTKVDLPTEEFDPEGEFASDRHTPLRAGTYLYIGSATFTAVGDGKKVTGNIYKNGASFKQRILTSGGTLDFSAVSIALISMNGSTDYAEFYVHHTDTVSRSLYASASIVYFQGIRLGD